MASNFFLQQADAKLAPGIGWHGEEPTGLWRSARASLDPGYRASRTTKDDAE